MSLAGQVERRHDLKMGRLGSVPETSVGGVAEDESASGLINWDGDTLHYDVMGGKRRH